MVSSSRVAALSVGALFAPRLDPVLRLVELVHQGKVGWVDASKINLDDGATRSWIDAQHARLGRPAGASVRLGYYLFLDGEVWAYHSGLIDFKRDTASLWMGAGAVLAGMHWQSTFWYEQAVRAAYAQAHARVLECFAAAIAARQQHATPPPPVPEAAVDQVGIAFEVLGLAPSATRDEVKARFRALAKEWHPDRFTNDAPKLTEASVRMSQINVAYSVICEAGGW